MDFLNYFFTCMCSLRDDMYNCKIFKKNKINEVKNA